MSLLIKGGVMPLMCEECPCYDCADYSCNATGRGVIEYRYSGRPHNCPLVEIPTPHGDLIDRTAVQVNYIIQSNKNPLLIMDEAPTIIEAEER